MPGIFFCMLLRAGKKKGDYFIFSSSSISFSKAVS